METIFGKVASFGYAAGPAFILEETTETKAWRVEDRQAECERLKNAIETLTTSYTTAKAIAGEVSSEIIDAQVALLNDPVYFEKIVDFIKTECFCAEYAVSTVGKSMADELTFADDPYISARSADILGISNRLINTLAGVEEKSLPNYPVIIFAKELSPEFVSTIDRARVLGFVSEQGSKTSHVSILCGDYGIPYLYGVNFDGLSVEDGTEAAIDTGKQALILNPDEPTKKEIVSKVAASSSQQQICPRIKTYANISSPSDIEAALKYNADGIGLYRTEFLYMKDSLPDEETQFEAYKAVLQAMDGREVIIRTMDIGADKSSPCLRLSPEANPALGRRAIRICLDDVDLFRTQLRALLRAGVYGNLSVMFPMITSVSEINDIKEQMKISINELDAKSIPYRIPAFGIMVETPAAAIMSDELSKHVDFFSIGTNDLTQYTLALDRMNEDLDRFFDPYSESVMRLIELVITNAHKNGIKVGICGELAGDPNIAGRLVKMGMDELSMSSAKLPIIRKTLAEIYTGDGKEASVTVAFTDVGKE